MGWGVIKKRSLTLGLIIKKRSSTLGLDVRVGVSVRVRIRISVWIRVIVIVIENGITTPIDYWLERAELIG